MSPTVRLPKAVFEFFEAGDSIADIADNFEITTEECERLLRVFCKILTLPKSKAQFSRLLKKYVPGNQPGENWLNICFAASYAHHYGYEMPEWARQAYSDAAKKIARNCL